MTVSHVAVAGLGLIGGSVARDLAAAGVRISAWDDDPATLAAGVAAGVVSTPLDRDLAGVEGVDVFLLAVPVTEAPALLQRAAPRLAGVRLITDAGSTKRSIARAALRLGLGSRFVGAHPLAGGHRSGWTASWPALFRGALVYLCPTAETRPEALTLARSLWQSLGARPQEMDAEAHDQRLAWISHLPQLLSSALGATLAEQGIPRGELGPGGRDVTRLAGSSPAMWSAIAADNRDLLLAPLHALRQQLDGLVDSLDSGDAPAIGALLARAHAWSADESGQGG